MSLTVVDPGRRVPLGQRRRGGELTTDGADAQIDRLAKKYLDADSYPFRKEGEQRVTVRIPRGVASKAWTGL